MGSKLSGSPLKKRVLEAGAWAFGGHAASQLFRLASNLLMTRLLLPEMFGIMAVANLVIMGTSLLSDLGIKQNVVRSNRGSDPVFLGTAWTVQIGRGIVLSVFVLLVAAALALANESNLFPAGSAYAAPVLPQVIAMLSLAPLINGFQSIAVALANRNMAIRQLVRIKLFSQLISLLPMVAWAVHFRSIWALVVGALVAEFVNCVLSHSMLHGDRYRCQFDRSAFREIVTFGKWMLLSSVLGFFALKGDRILLAGFLDSKTMGLYAIATLIVLSTRGVIVAVVRTISLPALSEVIRNRPHELRRIYYEFRIVIDVVSGFALGCLFVSGHTIVNFLFSESFHGAGRMVEILSVSLLEARYVLASQCFVAFGKPKLLSHINLVRLISIYTLLPLAYHFAGLEGALWVAGGIGLLSVPMILYFKYTLGFLSLRKEFIILPPILLGYLAGQIINSLYSYL